MRVCGVCAAAPQGFSPLLGKRMEVYADKQCLLPPSWLISLASVVNTAEKRV